MDELGRAWRRRALAAGGVVAVAPVAMVVAALAIGLGGGGAGRLELLAQAFSGPQAPPAERPPSDAERRADRERDPAQLLAALTPEPSPGSASRARDTGAPRPAAGGGPSPAGGDGVPTVPVPSPGGGSVTAPAEPGAGPEVTAGGGAPPAAATPEPGPGGEPGAIGQAGDQISEVVAPVPGVGGPASGLIDGVTDQLDEAVPIPPSVIPRPPGAGRRSRG